MPEGNPLGYVILLIALIGCNAFFAMSEIAVITFNDAKLKLLAENGDKRAIILKRLTSDSSKFLATIQVGVTLAGLLSSAVAADTFSEYVVALFARTQIAPSVVKMISLILITVLLAFVNLVFGELVPKRIAMNNPEKVSFSVARILLVVSVIAKPFVALLSATTNGVLRLIGIDPNKQNNEVTEEEIRMMIDVGEERGTIEEDEKEMLHNIFEFDDTTAGDIMTHRTEIEGLDINASLDEAIALSVKTGHSRIPVCDGSLDDIVGILNIKDLLNFVGTRPNEFKISDYLRKVMYVPESSRCKDIFEDLRRRHLQLAVVVDEYGGTAGIVTMEDILESIVGNIQDEYDHELEDITSLENGEYLIDGMAFLDDISDALDIVFDDAGDYDTIAGYITDKLGRLPDENEKPSIEKDGYILAVDEVKEHRVSRVRATKLPDDTENK